MNQTVKHFYEFGPYRMDLVDGLLLRDGRHVPLTPKAYETLLTLVESGGHVIDKEDLIKRIWPDTFVEEVNLAKNVSNLRKILGGTQSDQYIETIPKRGYRFVAGVREVWDEPETAGSDAAVSIGEAQEGSSGERHADEEFGVKPHDGTGVAGPFPSKSQSWANRSVWSMLLLILGLLAGGVLWMTLIQRGSKSATPISKIIPLTSFPGRETQPSFSPDGGRIAFVWDGEKGGNTDIYVKQIGSHETLRLTSDQGVNTHPAWSPDGRYLAFVRQSADNCAVYLIPSTGGPERRIREIFRYQIPTQGNSPYYSPDGKHLAVADKTSPEEPFSIYLLSIQNGEKRKVTQPPAGTEGDYYPAFSPDGKTLAFIRSTSLATTDIYLMPLSGGQPRRLTSDNTSILGLDWTASGRELVFASRRGSSSYNLWRIPAAGGVPERLAVAGQRVHSPTLSRRGNLLAYTQTMDDLNIWRLELDSAGRGGSPIPLISSTLSDNGPDYSPDGLKIVFASDRTGDFGIWVCDRDGSNPVQLVNRGSFLTGTPRWSPDGRWIAYDSRSSDPGREGNADIYVVSAAGGAPRRLTMASAENVAPSWSRDGKWIYYGSTRSGGMQIWKVLLEGGDAVQLTRQGGFEGFESIDGKIFYYAKGRGVPGIWRVPAAGGEEKPILDTHQAGYWRLWTVTEKGIYFATAFAPSQPAIEFFDFASGKVTQVAALGKRLSRSEPGFSVSPDRRWLLFSQMDQIGSDIMLVENFR